MFGSNLQFLCECCHSPVEEPLFFYFWDKIEIMKPHIRSFILAFTALLAGFTAKGNDARRMTRQEYIDHFAKVAIQEMNEFHIPASITLAQGCLESGDGNSSLARDANNHFGIKCNNGWTGKSVRHDDDSRRECFRKYQSAWESYRDHSLFLRNNVRYAQLFSLKITDYKGWAKGLKRAGYATDPRYPERLIRIIEEYQLYDLDKTYDGKDAVVSTDNERQDDDARTSGNDNNRIDHFSIDLSDNQSVTERNGTKSIRARQGDTYEELASEYGLKDWEIFHYNDTEKGHEPAESSIVYLEMKPNQAARGNDYHIARDGETMWQISQQYSIRLKSLYRKNRMKQGDEPQPGQQIWLRSKKPRRR
jgi:LysM repeat protein